MPDFYGVRVTENPTSIAVPVTAPSAVMAFGTAPVHQTGHGANEIVLANTYQEAVRALGYSDDWNKYTLCEVMHTFFKLYNTGPLILVNVLDPATQKQAVTAAQYDITDGQIILTADVIPSSIVVKNTAAEPVTGTAGTDYDVFFNDGKCVIELLPDGAFKDETKLSVVFDKIKDFTNLVSELSAALIGGYNINTGKSSGLELADSAYFHTRVIPDILIAPGFSQESDVAAMLAAKAANLSGVFRSFAVCDLPVSATTTQSVVSSKNASGSFLNVKQRVCWPSLKLSGKIYHFSTHAAALMQKTAAAQDGIPSEPASNKILMADSASDNSGNEICLDLTQANYLRGQGITTALGFINGLSSWGEYCACAPQNSDPKDAFCNIARMVNYIANTCVLTYWSYIDRKMTPRLAGAITDSVNIWLNGLTAQGHLLGGRCELLTEENPVTDLMAGIIRPHFYIGVPAPAQTIDFIVEYDASYLSAIFS